MRVYTCVYFDDENHRGVSRLAPVVVYGRKMYVYLGDDTRRIVGKGGCFPLWTPLDVGIDYTPSDVRGGHEARAVQRRGTVLIIY